MTTLPGLERDVLIACAISAGIHAVLAPGHFAKAIEATGLLAAGQLLWRSRPFVSVLHLQPKGS